MLEIINLSKSFDGRKVLHDINIKVKEGEIYGFLGPNGAGKSTTVKIMAGIYVQDSGSVLIDGKDNRDIDVKKTFGYMPDEPYVYERLNTKEFLSFVADIYDIQDRDRKIKAALTLFDIDENPDLNIENLSRGSRQKLVIAATLMHDPKILIIDEPLIGLDPKSVIQFQKILEDFSKNQGIIFLSTHSLDIASKICTRIGIINHGKIIDEGTIDELKSETLKNNLEDVFLKLTYDI